MDSRCICWKPTAPEHQLDCPLGRVERERARLADTGSIYLEIPISINQLLVRDVETRKLRTVTIP